MTTLITAVEETNKFADVALKESLKFLLIVLSLFCSQHSFGSIIFKRGAGFFVCLFVFFWGGGGLSSKRNLHLNIGCSYI